MTAAQFPNEQSESGEFTRQEDAFRKWVGSDQDAAFPAAPNRYHLYVCYACPWAHRTIILRRLKGLEGLVGMTAVDPIRDERGWRFAGNGKTDGETDPVNGWKFLSEAYRASMPGYEGRVTVPVLWDKETNQIVNNSEDDIMRMFNRVFDPWIPSPGQRALDFYPKGLRSEIDRLAEGIYENVNDGVYKAGFATEQTAYENHVRRLFDWLDLLETRLSRQRYLLGNRITEVDWKLFVTLIRFDAVYHGHFKCNLRRIADYPHLHGYLRDLYQQPGIAETVNMDDIKRHYYVTHDDLNPNGIVPIGPEENLRAPSGRETWADESRPNTNPGPRPSEVGTRSARKITGGDRGQFAEPGPAENHSQDTFAMTTTAEKTMEHIGETKGAANHDHDMVHELSKRLDALWRFDQYIANAEKDNELKQLWQDLKAQETENVKRLKACIRTHIEKNCF